MSTAKGELGEKLALAYLQKRGHRLVQKNFRSRFGEIDLITQHQSELYFTEVKSYSSHKVLHPIHHITKSKIHKISQTIKYYMSRYNVWDTQIHTNVILIIEGKVETVIEDAFELSY